MDIINVRRSIVRYDPQNEKEYDVVPIVVDSRSLHMPLPIFSSQRRFQKAFSSFSNSIGVGGPNNSQMMDEDGF